jgi:hypothetical protein
MALRVTNINELKSYKDYLVKYKNAYDETIDRLVDSIKLSAIYWQGEDGSNFRDKLYSLIGTNLNSVSNEINAEIEYLDKLILVLENAQEQIKHRLNW